MKISKLFILLLFVFSFSSVHAQREKPATQAELDAITARGKMLYEYDAAAWHSTDAVLALSPVEGSFTKYIARKNENGWVVAYGKYSDKKDKFLITYEAVQSAKPEEFKVTKYEKPKENTDFYFNAANAHDTVVKDFINSNPPQRPYNFAVLPTDGGEFFVYALPSQTEVGIFPLGGDIRYKVSKDGLKIIEKRQMHKSIIEFTVPSEVEELSAVYHTAILDEIPEDSDVFHVLARTPKVPEWVFTDKFVYQIFVDGKIKYIMTRKAFTNIGKEKSK